MSVYVDDIALARKKQNFKPTWKILMKDVDLEEPVSFLDLDFGVGAKISKIQKSSRAPR